jgi:transcriptional regulator with XRE-family HTH domain
MKHKQMEQLAGHIRQLRISKNYSQEYMAAKMHISQNAYSKIELNYSRMTVDRLIDIAKILDTDAPTLMMACYPAAGRAA